MSTVDKHRLHNQLVKQCKLGDIDEIAKLIPKVNINRRKGRALRHTLIYQCDRNDIIDLLVSNGACITDVNILHYACQHNRLDIFKRCRELRYGVF